MEARRKALYHVGGDKSRATRFVIPSTAFVTLSTAIVILSETKDLTRRV